VLIGALAGPAVMAQTAQAPSAASFAPFALLGELDGAPSQGMTADPVDGRIVYADGGAGRILRTFSGGAHWDVSQVGGVRELFRTLTVDPANTSVVLAFSTSEIDGGASGGVYLSRDRGDHWQRLPQQPTGAFGTAGLGRGILVDVRRNLILVADKLQGVFRSADFGATWSNTLPGSAARTYALARDPNDSMSYWAGGRDGTGATAVWVSRDAGQTWNESVLPADPGLRGALVTSLAIQPGSSRIVVGTNGITPDFNLGGDIFVSGDGGGHWTPASVTADHWAAGNTIAFDPAAPALAYASGNGVLGLLRSFDGGLTWTQQLIHDGSAFFALAVSPPVAGRGSRVFACGSGTIESSDDAGTTWALSQRGLALLAAALVHDDGRTPLGVYAQNGFGGLMHSVDGGTQWLPIDPVANVFQTLDFAVDSGAPSRSVYSFYALPSGNDVYRSDAAGRTWTKLNLAIPRIYQEQLLTDPSRPGFVYLYLFSTSLLNIGLRSVDFGATWQSATIGVDGDFPAVQLPLATDPNHAGVLYAAMGSGLWKSADFGATWSPVPALPLGLFGIAGLTVTGGASGAVLVSAGDESGNFSLQVSRDGGSTWTTGASAFGTSPYVLTAGGASAFAYQYFYDFCSDPSILRSPDGGSTWSLVDAPIETQFPGGDCLSVNPTATHLYISDPYGSYLAFALDPGRGLPKVGWQQAGPGRSASATQAAIAQARRTMWQNNRQGRVVRAP
jgi:hypothetical protein